jgi:DNA-binding response OmpR family regulator
VLAIFFKRAIANGYSKPLRGIMDAFREVQSRLDQIRASSPSPSVGAACDQIEVLCRAQFAPTEDFLPNVNFTRAERFIINMLKARMGKTVNKEALLDSYGWASNNAPHPATLGVLICRIRATLKTAKAPYHIETAQGIGYRLVNGFQPKWDGSPVSKSQYMPEYAAA